MTRQCSICKVTKPLDEFYAERHRKGGRGYRCKKCDQDKVMSYYWANPEAQRNRNLRNLYGMTLDEYNIRLASQDHCCAICGTNDPKGGHGRLVVDHDHNCCSGSKSCGKCVRGLICAWCNTLLGVIESDLYPQLLAYLNNQVTI